MFKYYIVTEHYQISKWKHPLLWGCFHYVSPKGVNYYESKPYKYLEKRTRIVVSVPNRGYLLWAVWKKLGYWLMVLVFPSPTGVNYYEYSSAMGAFISGMFGFPSPTGVNYYELACRYVLHNLVFGFRPQQGLTIMNSNWNSRKM